MSGTHPADFLRRVCGHQFPPLGLTAYRAFFKLMPDAVETELVPGIRARLDLRDLTQRTTYWQGARFEYPTAEILAAWGRAGAEVFFDVGSNYGFFSYWMLSQTAGLRVEAFEPNPATHGLVRGIIERNGLRRMRAWNVGLSDAPGRLMLHAGVVDSGHSTFGEHPELAGGAKGEVEVLPFDAWRRAAGLELPGKPAWVAKIDVEGFETRVLRGMRGALAARAFAGLMVEINEYTLKLCGTSPAEVFGLLEEAGYVSLRETEAGRRWPLARTANAFFVPRG